MKTVSYLAPLITAWQGMKTILFTRFDVVKWLILAFAAWLASLGEGVLPIWRFPRGLRRAGVVGDVAERVASSTDTHLFLTVAVGAALILLGAALWLVLLWINARAKFVFLDNVIQDRAEVADPWRRLRARGNSLFLWRLGFLAVCTALGVAIAAVSALVALPFATRETLRPLSLLGAAVAGSLAFSTLVAVAYIRLFLEDFVIPLMHKLNLGAARAWGHFMVLLRAHFMGFVVYGLVRLALALLVSGVIVLALLCTCFLCCAGFLLFVPYLGALLLLPVAVFFRLYGPAFLSQFGPEYDCLGERPPATPRKAHGFNG